MSYLSQSRYRVEGVAPTNDLDLLRSRLRPTFLTEVGWDPQLLILAPPRVHPLLGVLECAVQGCSTGVRSRNADLCASCYRRHQASDLPFDDFIAIPPNKPQLGERFCVVNGCPRPSGLKSGLCGSHQANRLRYPDWTVQEWITHTQPTGYPSFGSCQVQSCLRVAAWRDQMCPAHGLQWRKFKRTNSNPDLKRWVRFAEPIDVNNNQAVFRGLPELVIIELLIALQWRTDDHARTTMSILRAVIKMARQRQAESVFDLVCLPTDQLKGERGSLVRSAARAVQRTLSSPEAEQSRDRWDLAMFGARGQIDFTVIHQDRMRAAAKHWVLEDLPLHRGAQSEATAKITVRAVGELSISLRNSRPDHGRFPSELGRQDILTFTNQLAHHQRTGELSAIKRARVSRRVRRFLDDLRSFGLTRPGGILEGLSADFVLRAGDVPRDPEFTGTGRDIPASVLRTINDHLPLLEELSNRNTRRVIELLIDTGRRPDEICQLPWDCLDSTGGGQVLIYTDFKNNRPRLRLPIGADTAAVIRTQRDEVRDRFPTAPLDQLALFPRSYRNPTGQFSIDQAMVTNWHRKFIDHIADKLRDDAGQPFPPAVVVPYCYRHSYAQRHADSGAAPDVLRDLMGHRSMETTMGYYRVTEVRVRRAVEQVALQQFDGQGRRVFMQVNGLIGEEHTRLRVGQVAVPFGICTEPANVKAGGHACPYKFTCVGCGHFRSDASYLPELKSYLQQLLSDRERIMAATDIQDWARAKAAPATEEITQLRDLIHRVEHELGELDPRTKNGSKKQLTWFAMPDKPFRSRRRAFGPEAAAARRDHRGEREPVDRRPASRRP